MGIIKDLKITKDQSAKITELLKKYSLEQSTNLVHRYPFEDDMAKIDKRLEQNTQLTELMLIEIATKENNIGYKKLFLKLYGDMNKYEDIFPEVR